MEAGLTLGSLFDGIGGFCYAAQLTGRITPIWAAEIEPSCIDITRYRFPERVSGYLLYRTKAAPSFSRKPSI